MENPGGENVLGRARSTLLSMSFAFAELTAMVADNGKDLADRVVTNTESLQFPICKGTGL